MKQSINIIAAHDSKLGIGKDNNLLWDISEDMKHFKTNTMNKIVIMGRKTWDSLGKWKPLPNRVNIVVTRNKSFTCEADQVCNSLEEALEKAQKYKKPIFIIGGGMLYSEGMKFADKLYLTRVEGDFEADTFFPEYKNDWIIVKRQKGLEKLLEYEFVELVRK